MDQLIEWLNAFLAADLDGRHKLVEANKDALFTDEVRHMLQELADAQEDQERKDVVLSVGVFLAECLRHGIDQTFERFTAVQGEASLPANAEELQTLIERIFALQDNPETATETISLCEIALRFIGQDTMPELWAALQGKRANALQRLGDLAGDPAVLRAAVAAYDAALEVYTRDTSPADWAMTQNNRANALSSLGKLAGDPAVLRAAVAGYDAALEVYTRDASPANWVTTQNNRANALQSLGDLAGDPAVLRAAVAAYDAALEVYTRDASPANWAMTQNNRANALSSLGDLAGDPAVLRAAVAGYDAALEVWNEQAHPQSWASARRARIQALRSLWKIDHDHAGLVAKMSGEVPRLARNTLLARGDADRRKAVSVIGPLSADLAAAHLSLGDPARALAVLVEGRGVQLNLSEAMGALDRQVRFESERALEAESDVGRAGSETVSASDAVVLGLRPLRQALLEAQAHHGKLEERWLALQGRGEELAADPEAQAQLTALKAELEASEAELSARFEAFSQAVEASGLQSAPMPPLEDMSAALPAGGAMVSVLASGIGGAAIILPEECTELTEDHVLWLEDLNSDRVTELLAKRREDGSYTGWLADYAAYKERLFAADRGSPEAQFAALSPWNDAVVAMQHVLWDLLMGPLDARLRDLELKPGAEIVMMAPGQLANLPLQAACAESAETCFLDDWALSQIPTLQLFFERQARARAYDPESRQLLAVTDPLGDLKGSGKSLKNPVWSLFSEDRRAGLREEEATVKAVRAELSGATHLSFYCHGTFNSMQPDASGLAMRATDDATSATDIEATPDRQAELLTVSQLRAADLSKSRMALLGACETALIDYRQAPDEFTGLPAALMEAGVPCVIASNWIAYTDVTTLLMHHTLDLQMNHGLSSAQALRQATLEMRNGKLCHDNLATTAQFERSTFTNKPSTPPDQPPLNHHWPARWATFSNWGV